MQYPSNLVNQIKKQTAHLHLEGLLSGQGPINPALMIIGEAPGKNEIVTHIPFSGRAGKELMTSLAMIGFQRQNVYITSVVRSRPYAIKQVKDKQTGTIKIKYPNRPPTKKEVLIYAPLFDWELQQVNPQVIVTVGNTSLQRLLGNKFNVGKDHGQIFKQSVQIVNAQGTGYQLSARPYLIIPTFHPAAIFYNRKLAPLIQADWQRIGNYLQQGPKRNGTNDDNT